MSKDKKFQFVLIIFASVLGICLFLTFFFLISANRQMETALKNGNMNYSEYEKHFALILNSDEEHSQELLLRGCQTEGAHQNVYVELFGAGLSEEYTTLDLMSMAIDANVDGIILEADETEEYREKIKQASDKGIPVVTIGTDCMESARVSFIGIGSYDLGREYARQIIKVALKTDKTVLVLMDKDEDDSTQNIICNGIRETLANEGNHLNLDVKIMAVDSQSYFSADESIRNILTTMDKLPDFIVCLTEQDTEIVYNAMINYNIVGEMKLFGYYTSDTILSGIEKGIITSTVAIDYEKMGATCVSALQEYCSTGIVNGYFLMDVNTINGENIKEYLEHDTNNE